MSQTETSQFHQSANNTPQDSNQSSEASEAQENHLLLIEDDKGRRVFPLEAPVYSLGREPSCDIRLFSMFVSRQHATLRRQDVKDGSYRYQIVDGNLEGQPSTSGISVNGRKINTYELKDGDQVKFPGSVSVKYYRLKPEKRHKQEDNNSGPPEFDITLIDPSMLESDEGEIASYQEFERVALDVYNQLNRDHDLDNLVPVSRIQQKIGDRVSRDQFNKWMLEMQRNDIFQLIGEGVSDATPDQVKDSITPLGGTLRYYAKCLDSHN